ncbi:unnamed protein product, partial [Rotaria sp. Silwood2]
IIITLQDELIYLNTLQFLNKLCQNGWKANERIIINLIDLSIKPSTTKEANLIIREILQKQNRIDFLMIDQYLYNLGTNENKQIEQLIENYKIKIPNYKFEELYSILMNQPSAKIESRILKILQCTVYNGQSLSKDLLCYISSSLNGNNTEILVTILSKVIENGQILIEDIIHTIQNLFIRTDTNSILNLIRRLAEQYTTFRNDTIEHLFNKIKTYPDILSTIEIIAEYQQIPINILRPYLNENLSSDNILIVRSSFIILQYQILNNYIEEPFEFLTKVLLPEIIDQDKLTKELLSINQYLGIIRTLLSIEYFQPNIFQIYPVNQWSRECLCYDLLVRTII